MKRILFLNPVGAIGGAERVLLTLLTALKRHRPDLELHLLLTGIGPLQGAAEAIGVIVHILPLPSILASLGDSSLGQSPNSLWHLGRSLLASLPPLATYVTRLRQVIGRIQPNLVHSNGIKTHLLCALVQNSQIPLVWHVHDFYSRRPLMATVLGWASRRVDRAIAISHAVQQDLQHYLPKIPVSLVYNCVDPQEFQPSAKPEGATIHIALVATFARWKGQDCFLQAAAQVLRACPDRKLQFWIVGGPIYQTHGSQFSLAELQQQAAALELGSHVTFTGFRSDMPALYPQMDIVVHASTQPEPLGMTILEAMACGRAVIVSQSGGAAELFRHGKDAWGVPPADSSALAIAIQTLVEQPQLRQKLGLQARQTILQRFNIQNLGSSLLQIYSDLGINSIVT